MSRIVTVSNLTKAEADQRAQDCRDDVPPAVDVQTIKQGDGKFTVICTYPVADDAAAEGKPKGGST
jgi:hypothetical protein